MRLLTFALLVVTIIGNAYGESISAQQCMNDNSCPGCKYTYGFWPYSNKPTVYKKPPSYQPPGYFSLDCGTGTTSFDLDIVMQGCARENSYDDWECACDFKIDGSNTKLFKTGPSSYETRYLELSSQVCVCESPNIWNDNTKQCDTVNIVNVMQDYSDNTCDSNSVASHILDRGFWTYGTEPDQNGCVITFECSNGDVETMEFINDQWVYSWRTLMTGVSITKILDGTVSTLPDKICDATPGCPEGFIQDGTTCKCAGVTVPNADMNVPALNIGQSYTVVCQDGFIGGGSWTCGTDGSSTGSGCSFPCTAGDSNCICPQTHVQTTEGLCACAGRHMDYALSPLPDIPFGTTSDVTCYPGYYGGGSAICTSYGEIVVQACSVKCSDVKCNPGVTMRSRRDTDVVDLSPAERQSFCCADELDCYLSYGVLAGELTDSYGNTGPRSSDSFWTCGCDTDCIDFCYNGQCINALPSVSQTCSDITCSMGALISFKRTMTLDPNLSIEEKEQRCCASESSCRNSYKNIKDYGATWPDRYGCYCDGDCRNANCGGSSCTTDSSICINNFGERLTGQECGCDYDCNHNTDKCVNSICVPKTYSGDLDVDTTAIKTTVGTDDAAYASGALEKNVGNIFANKGADVKHLFRRMISKELKDLGTNARANGINITLIDLHLTDGASKDFIVNLMSARNTNGHIIIRPPTVKTYDLDTVNACAEADLDEFTTGVVGCIHTDNNDVCLRCDEGKLVSKTVYNARANKYDVYCHDGSNWGTPVRKASGQMYTCVLNYKTYTSAIFGEFGDSGGPRACPVGSIETDDNCICPGIPLAHANTLPDTIIGSSVSVTCDTGYTGGGQWTCQSNGAFTGTLCYELCTGAAAINCVCPENKLHSDAQCINQDYTEGYTTDLTESIECPAGTDSSTTNGFSCTQCSNDQYRPEGSEQLCQSCPTGYVSTALNGISCEPCTCSNGVPSRGDECPQTEFESCASCSAGYILKYEPKGDVGCISYDNYYYLESTRTINECKLACSLDQDCNAYGFKADLSFCYKYHNCGPDTVSWGDPMFSLHMKAGAICEECPIGQYVTAGACTVNNDYTYGIDAESNLVECGLNEDSSGSNGHTCATCPSGKYALKGELCIDRACSDGPGYGLVDGTCQICPAGTYSVAGDACIACAVGTYSLAGSAQCTSCAVGKSSTEGSTDCADCPARKTSTGFGGPCLCKSNYHQNDNICAVFNSDLNKFIDSNGDLSTCPGNQVNAQTLTRLRMGGDIDGEAAGDNSGVGVALSSDGSIMAVGAYNNDGNGANSGHVRVYQWNGTAWNQLGDDINGDAAQDAAGYTVALSSDGSIVAFGAPSSNTGHIRIYKWNGNAWNQLGGDIIGGAEGDGTGYSLALSSDGSIIAIGAPFHNSMKGYVRIYKWNGNEWNQMGHDIDGAASFDAAGYSVALSSDGFTVAVGAHYHDSYKGHVRVYQFDGIWNQLGSDIDGQEYDVSGRKVSLSSDGSIIAISAVNHDSAKGTVRVHKWDGNTWNQRGGDIDGEAASDYSGSDVALSSDGSIVAIGADRNDDGGVDSGHVRVYQWNQTAWNKLGGDIDGDAENDASGYSLSLSSDGSIVAIGAFRHDGEKGHVRVYFTQETTAITTAANICVDNDCATIDCSCADLHNVYTSNSCQNTCSRSGICENVAVKYNDQSCGTC